MAQALTARVSLIAGDHFQAVSSMGGVVELLSSSPEGESAEATNEPLAPAGAVSPMESVLIALGGCLGMSIAPVMRKMRLDVTGYTITVTGTTTERPPRVFASIAVAHHFTGRDLDRSLLERAVTLGETRGCGVSAMLGKAVSITHSIAVVDA